MERQQAARPTGRTDTGVMGRFALVAVVCLGLAACSGSSGGAPQQEAPQVSVITLQPQAAPIVFELPGRTVSYMSSDVRPQIGGIIQKRLFEEGSNVKQGQLLYLIDPAPYEAAEAQAKAALARAEANLVSVSSRADRYGQLVGIDAVSKQEAEDAAAAKGQAEADVAAARAALKTASINLGYTRVTAPISGRIGRSSFTPGALVTAGQPAALATIQSLDPIYVDVTQSSAEMLRIRRAVDGGQVKAGKQSAANVRLTLPDGTAYAPEGKLEFSEVSVDPSTGSVVIRAVFPNPDRILLPGMYVRATLTAGVDPQAILAPQQAITRNVRGQATAMVIDDEGRAQERIVVASRVVGDQWVIDSGLKSGDRLIVDGFQHIRPGIEVTAVDAAQTSGAAK